MANRKSHRHRRNATDEQREQTSQRIYMYRMTVVTTAVPAR
jgi:hypothetical protein